MAQAAETVKEKGEEAIESAKERGRVELGG